MADYFYKYMLLNIFLDLSFIKFISLFLAVMISIDHNTYYIFLSKTNHLIMVIL